jgi:two-component system response regulator YesN
MYKVMLVDDDYLVLSYLQEIVPWERLGLQLVGMYEDGMDAYKATKENHPDILITDIGMPVMDGLELIGRLQEEHKELHVVILSCHNDFQYAQKAVKLNVHEYVLKETLNAETIVPLLTRLIEYVDQARDNREHLERFKQIAEQQHFIYKEKFIRSVLHQPILSDEEWHKAVHVCGLSSSNVVPVTCFVNQFQHTLARFQSGDTLKFAMENILNEVVESSAAIVFPYQANETILLFPSHNSLVINVFQTIRDTLSLIQKALMKYLKVDTSFIIGDVISTPGELKRQLKLLTQTADQRFYLRSLDAVKLKELSPSFSQEDIFSSYAEISEACKRLILEQDENQIGPQLDQWFKKICQERYQPEDVKSFFLKIMMDLQVRLRSIQRFQTFYAMEISHKKMNVIETVDELKQWMFDYLHECVHVMKQMANQSLRIEIAEAQRYAEMNLNKKITLEEIADRLELNPSYFSRLFKKETGEGFIEFVTRLKMNKAKEWLLASNKTIDELSELLGYESKSYFVRTFKNQVGVTPAEYVRN